MCSYVTLQCACWNLRKQMNEFLLHLRVLTMKITTNRGQFSELGILRGRHLTCLLRNLCAGQKATVRTGHETMDWFPIGKGVHKSSIWSSCLFNLCAEYIMWNAELNEAQAGINIAGRISVIQISGLENIRYPDDTTLMAESKERKSLLMKVKQESERAGLKFNIQKTKIMASSPITSWQRWGNHGNGNRLYFLGLHITADGDWSHEIKRCLLLGRKVMTNLDSILNSRDITLPTKVLIVKAMVFSSSHVQMWDLDHK